MFARSLVSVGSVSSARAAGTASPRSALVGIGIARAVTTHRMISLFFVDGCVRFSVPGSYFLDFALIWGGCFKKAGNRLAPGSRGFAVRGRGTRARSTQGLGPPEGYKGFGSNFLFGYPRSKVDQYCGAPELAQTRPTAISPPIRLSFRHVLPDFKRLGVKGSGGVPQNGLDRRFPRVGRQGRGRSDGGTSKA
jgi:hypothetical protein